MYMLYTSLAAAAARLPIPLQKSGVVNTLPMEEEFAAAAEDDDEDDEVEEAVEEAEGDEKTEEGEGLQRSLRVSIGEWWLR